jgi:hypothetical protein
MLTKHNLIEAGALLLTIAILAFQFYKDAQCRAGGFDHYSIHGCTGTGLHLPLSFPVPPHK